MSFLLNTSSQLTCPHGGQVQITSSNSKAKGGGDFLIRPSDTFTISGCPFTLPPPAGTPHPCMSLQWLTMGMKAKADGDFVLTQDSAALCKAADQVPQGSVLINSTQTKVSGM
jgi:hypothetical protein